MQAKAETTLLIHHAGRERNIALAEFLLFKSHQKHVYAVFKNGQEILINHTLKELEDNFADALFRIHRSTLINKQHIDFLEKDAQGAVLVGLVDYEQSLVVSRRHVAELRRFFKKTNHH